MRRIGCGLLCLLLVGCNDIFSTATAQDLAACEVEATKVQGAGDMGDLTFRCMKAKGYALADSCQPAKDGQDQQKNEITERCYGR
jgi:hypothetical protein